MPGTRHNPSPVQRFRARGALLAAAMTSAGILAVVVLAGSATSGQPSPRSTDAPTGQIAPSVAAIATAAPRSVPSPSNAHVAPAEALPSLLGAIGDSLTQAFDADGTFGP